MGRDVDNKYTSLKMTARSRRATMMGGDQTDPELLPDTSLVPAVAKLVLTEKELAEEIPCILTAKNPEAPDNIVRFNQQTHAYKAEAIVSATIVHYATDGWLLSAGSDEAAAQHAMERDQEELKTEYLRETAKLKKKTKTEDVVELRNVFHFAGRAMQTTVHPLREREVQTDPPPVEGASGQSTFETIYDAYLDNARKTADAEQVAAEIKAAKRSKGAKGGVGAEEEALGAAAPDKDDEDEEETRDTEALSKAVRLMARSVSQNMFRGVILDCAYWEDESDQYRAGEGTLLPLWHDPCFRPLSSRRKHVTAVSWSPAHSDVFAVAYGSFDFARQGRGEVCVFSLKNPSEPECSYQTDSGAMCLDFHPVFHNLLAVGCYDGGAVVLDVAALVRGGPGSGEALYQANARAGKHSDPVWQVKWIEDGGGAGTKALQFYSVSTDGRIASWMVAQAEMTMSVAMELRLVAPRTGGDDDIGDALVHALAGGCCFDFNQFQDTLFVVGTEEGLVHKCSKAYSSQYLDTYRAHHMPVYAVRWNAMHPRVFLSASADWTVKLWDHATPGRPFLSFDLGSPVGDAAWAPYSSTVFAAVTADGRCHVYDIAQSKTEALCEQRMPSKRAKLTRVAFNPTAPTLLVGDEKGRVTVLKLSPNLRKLTPLPEPKEGEKKPAADEENKGPTREDVERAKMDHIISVSEKSFQQALRADAREGAAAGGGLESEASGQGKGLYV